MKNCENMIWNPIAYDYSAGITIYDSITGKIYTEDEAKQLPAEIKQRLCQKANKIGCWVMTIEEAKEANKRREEQYGR
jgi:hypothetical protein